MKNALEASMLHTLDPFLIKLGFIHEEFGLRWYGLAYLTGFVVGYFVVRWLVLRGRSPLKAEAVADFVTYVAVGTMVGGRLGYCLFYKPELLVGFRSSFPFWDVLAVHEGGMASHGGIAGVALACILFARRHKISILHTFDLCTIGGSIGIFCGRIANFINGELVGREAPKDLPWAVQFPQDMYTWPMDHLDQMRTHTEQLKGLAPAVSEVGVQSAQWLAWVQNLRSDGSSMASVRATIHSLILAVQNGNEKVAQVLSQLLTPRHPSQIYQALMEGLFVLLVCLAVWYKPRKPGIIASTFVVVYAVMRIIGEQFRLPDADIGYQALGLTRGQWLSVALLIFGLVIMTLWSRRDVAPMGGWGPQTAAPGKRRKS